MTKRYLLSILATNRIGALPAITGAIQELGGDMQEVSQTVMHSYLSMFLVADFPLQRDSQVIVDHINGAAKPFDAEVTIRESNFREPFGVTLEATDRFFLKLHGYDSPGLIRQVTSKLAAESIEITDLYAVREGVGEPVVMIFELAVPLEADLGPLRGELEGVGDPSGLSVELQHESLFAESSFPRPVRMAKAIGTQHWEES